MVRVVEEAEVTHLSLHLRVELPVPISQMQPAGPGVPCPQPEKEESVSGMKFGLVENPFPTHGWL